MTSLRVTNHFHLLGYVNRLIDPGIVSCTGIDSARIRNQMALIRAVLGLAIALGTEVGKALAVGRPHFAQLHGRVVLVVIAVGAVAVFLDVRDEDVQGGETGANKTDTTFGVSGSWLVSAGSGNCV